MLTRVRYVVSAGACSSWVHTDNHAPRTFRRIQMQINGAEEIVTPTESAAAAASMGRSNHAGSLPSLADSEAQKFEPHVTRLSPLSKLYLYQLKFITART